MSAPIWYDSTEAGAPVLNNANGSLISLLKAVLVNGFNVKAITSITVASGVATVLCPAHGYSADYGKRIKITGASAPLLNGTKLHTVVDVNNFTYAAPGVADGTYTATDARRAPLGWAESLNDGAGTKAIFERTATEALAAKLRVVDTGASPASVTSARTLVVDGVSSIDSFTSRAPLESQVSGGMHCNKGSNSATAKPWILIGSDRAVWLFTADPAPSNYVLAIAFFDVKPYRDADSKAVVLSGTGTAASTGTAQSSLLTSASLGTVPSGFTSVVLALSTGVGDPVTVSASGANTSGVMSSAGSVTTNADDFVFHRPIFCKDTAEGVRGELPGVAQMLASHTVVGNPHAVVQTIAGERMLVVKTTLNFSAGAVCFSLQDDWY